MAEGSNKTFASCGEFSSWNNVDAYLRVLRDNGGIGFDGILDACRYVICPTIFGSGNADISGIGLIVAYCIEAAFGLIFGIILCAYAPPSISFLESNAEDKIREATSYRPKARKAVIGLMDVYFDTSFMFSGSIVVVSLVFGIIKDANIGTSGLGAVDFEIAASVCLSTLLPLLLPLVLLPLPRVIDAKLQWRVGKMLVCAVLYFYVFVSRFIYAFRKHDNTKVLTPAEIEKLYTACSAGDTLSDIETRLINAFGLLGSLIFFLVVIAYTCYVLFEDRSESIKEWSGARLFLKLRVPSRLFLRLIFYTLTFVLVPLLCVAQLWTVMRMRAQQQAIAARSHGSASQIGTWGFGQVISICMWFPVLVEVFKLARTMTVERRLATQQKSPASPSIESSRVRNEQDLIKPCSRAW